MDNLSIENKDRLFISHLKLLYSFEKTILINIIVNENKKFMSKQIEVKKATKQTQSIVEIAETFEITEISVIDSIRFEIIDKNGASNLLYRGISDFKTSTNIDKDKETNFTCCYLTNSNQENAIIIYFKYEIKENIFDIFDKQLKKINGEKDVDNNYKTSIEHLRHLAGDNEAFEGFIRNISYLKVLVNKLVNIYNWKSVWKTLGFIIIMTSLVFYMKVFFIILPILLIYLHLSNHSNIQKFSLKNQYNKENDLLENLHIAKKCIEYINKIFYFYESILELVSQSNNTELKQMYKDLVKCFFYSLMYWFSPFHISFRSVFIIVLWSCFLWSNNRIQAFLVFILTFITKKVSYSENFEKLSKYITKILFIAIPFIGFFIQNTNNLLNKIKIEEKDTTDSPDTGNESEKEIVRYDILENERWWAVLGWTKTLFNNERPAWSDLTGKHNCTKESIFLPTSNKYVWASDWIMICDPNTTDKDGWRFANDVDSEFSKNSSMSAYVRNRRWYRISKLKQAASKAQKDSLSDSKSNVDQINPFQMEEKVENNKSIRVLPNSETKKSSKDIIGSIEIKKNV